MSRIFIQNLPKHINESELRKRFESKGEITDIRINKEKGHAIIGYKQESEANEAVNYFNKTYINASKISVKLSADQSDKFAKFNKNSTKFSKNKSNTEDNEEKNENFSKDEVIKKEKLDPFNELKDDPEFEQFLKVQRNIDSAKGKHVWSNDMIINDNKEVIDQSEDNLEEEQSEKDDDNASENKNNKNKSNKNKKKTESKPKFLPETIHEFTVKLKGLPYKVKKRQVKEFLKPLKPISLRLVPKVKGIAYVSFETIKELKQALIKHRGFLDGHRIEIVKCNVKEQKQTEANAKSNEPKWKNAEPAEEPVGESGRIFVRNLSYTCDENDLRELFAKYGELSEFHMPIDSYTKKPKGIAFVTFMFPEHAVKAFSELDRTDFQGRLLHLIPARAKPDKVEPPFAADDGSSFKKKKEIEKKVQANKSHQWNTLFIGSNAVADVMSKKFNIKKSELLADSNANDSVAVRMALGETQIVNEVRRFLLQNGVSLKSFSETETERSKNVILVKNLPANTKSEEISELFNNFGLVTRVILPPNGVTAIVEMQEPNEAKTAFNKLAYNNFKHYPLYLEWAPNNVFRDNSDENIDEEIEASVKPGEEDISNETTDKTGFDADVEPEDDTTIFVKNLNFDTNEEDFRNHFAKCGQIHSATIAYKKNSNEKLSMGYGFVQFVYRKSAQKALKEMQHSTLDGHSLELKISNRTTKIKQRNVLEIGRKGDEKQTGTKICVKNIPFEASIEDVKKLFSVFGELKAVRLPKKLAEIGSYRGFGFVDFVTKNDAKRAFDALCHSTHFYGRPLVLEWANDTTEKSSSIVNTEAKRVAAKTAQKFSKGPARKRLKKSDMINDLEAKTSITYTDD